MTRRRRRCSATSSSMTDSRTPTPTTTPLGLINFDIAGFTVGSPADVEIGYFVLGSLGEGGGSCNTIACQDFFSVNGTDLSDGFARPGTSSTRRPRSGWISTPFRIGTANGGSGILDTGATQAMIQTGSGDNIDPPDGADRRDRSSLAGSSYGAGRRPLAELPPRTSTSKVSDVGSAAPGGSITYTVTVTNQGSLDAHNVVVSDPLPVGMPDLAELDPRERRELHRRRRRATRARCQDRR